MFENVKSESKPVLGRTKKRKNSFLKFIFGRILYFDYFLRKNQIESVYINENLEEKEKETVKRIYKSKKLLPFQIKQSFKDEEHKELSEYINGIFEQHEKERIVKWLVNSIRESLDLDDVLERIVEKIGKLLKVDRCLIAIYNKNTEKFYLKNEYKMNEEIPSALEKDSCFLSELPNWYRHLLFENNNPIIINNPKEETLGKKQKNYLEINEIKSLIIIPVVHKNEILGAIMVHQVNYQRKWENTHIEILKDIASQIAIAIRQAILYTRIQESTKLKSEFLASMSHEFRTPLNAIIGFSEMILSEDFGKLNDKQRKFLNNITLSGKHLLNLVNDILDLSKIESGNMELNYEIFNVNIAIYETVSILKSMAIKKNISINTNLAENIVISADMNRFKQIMYNLLSNGIKFTEDNGQVSINSVFDNYNLKIEVIDTGIGISTKDKDKIFQEFRQIDSSYTRKQEGSGLGLKLTQKLIEMHKGIIDFESEAGKGSKFWFILPGAKVIVPNRAQQSTR